MGHRQGQKSAGPDPRNYLAADVPGGSQIGQNPSLADDRLPDCEIPRRTNSAAAETESRAANTAATGIRLISPSTHCRTPGKPSIHDSDGGAQWTNTIQTIQLPTIAMSSESPTSCTFRALGFLFAFRRRRLRRSWITPGPLGGGLCMPSLSRSSPILLD